MVSKGRVTITFTADTDGLAAIDRAVELTKQLKERYSKEILVTNLAACLLDLMQHLQTESKNKRMESE